MPHADVRTPSAPPLEAAALDARTAHVRTRAVRNHATPGPDGAGEGATTGAALATVPRADPRARDAGMATAEYAMATLAACGFAGLLIAILRSAEVKQLLLGVIRQALAIG